MPDFLASFYDGRLADIDPNLTENQDAARIIYTSTLLPLLVTKHHHNAAYLLEKINATIPERRVPWIDHRIAARFPAGYPGDKDDGAASVANAWLQWARAHGYFNAVAYAILGSTAEMMWAEETADYDCQREE